MKKMLTLLAAALVVASPFAIAESTGNSNDASQLAQPAQNEGTQGHGLTNVALGGTVPTDQNAASNDSNAAASDQTAKPAKKHHKKHHCKGHCKTKHHKKAKPAATDENKPATSSDATGTTDSTEPGTSGQPDNTQSPSQ